MESFVVVGGASVSNARGAVDDDGGRRATPLTAVALHTLQVQVGASETDDAHNRCEAMQHLKDAQMPSYSFLIHSVSNIWSDAVS